jgi:hypothetical protein
MSDAAASDPAAARRSRLLGIKLRALVAEHIGTDITAEPVSFAPGAALVHDGAGWVLLDERPAARLGASLAWGTRAGIDQLHVIAEWGTGALARRAASFDFPISVWHAEQRTLLPAVAEPLLDPEPPAADHLRFVEVIEAAGAETSIEHGVVAGEVGGLEVCRVVDDPTLGTTRLEVGVGTHDREAFAMLHGDEPPADALARVVAAVAPHRRLDADPHPLNRLGRERLLRWHLIAHPELVGASRLDAAQPPLARPNLKDPIPCVATGIDESGTELVVVCSVGVDLDLVPYSADARLAVEAARSNGKRRLLLVTPARDRLPVAEQLAGMLDPPAEFVSVG